MLLASVAFGQTPDPQDQTPREPRQEGRQGVRQGGRQGGRKIERMDTNQDGKISRDEWRGDAEVFKRLDTDNDGLLTREDIQSQMRAGRRGGRGVRNGRVGPGGRGGNGARAKMDQNKDGQISREEWKRKPEVFDRLDQNKDGVLTRDELKRGRNRTGFSTR
jgi:hypothetical protein